MENRAEAGMADDCQAGRRPKTEAAETNDCRLFKRRSRVRQSERNRSKAVNPQAATSDGDRGLNRSEVLSTGSASP
jgi:hypothetical protein